MLFDISLYYNKLINTIFVIIINYYYKLLSRVTFEKSYGFQYTRL